MAVPGQLQGRLPLYRSWRWGSPGSSPVREIPSYNWGGWGPGWEEPGPEGSAPGPAVPMAAALLQGPWTSHLAGFPRPRRELGKDGWADGRQIRADGQVDAREVTDKREKMQMN